MPLKSYHKFIFIIAILFTIGPTAYALDATLTTELKSKIDLRNSQIKQLEEEIKQYNTEIINTQGQAKTLVNTIKTLDLTNKKITSDINLTKKKISKTNLTIEQLGHEINKTKDHISLNKEAIIKALQSIQTMEDSSIITLVLSSNNIGNIWNEIDNNKQFQDVIRDKSKELSLLKSDLELKQNGFQNQKRNLTNLEEDLNGKKKVVQYTVEQKAVILAQTKNKEQAFKELVKTKEEQKAQFEKDVYEFEAQLNLTIDKGGYPVSRNGILFWPLDDVFVTQKFGKTVGAEKLYVSGSHNGVDFRASVGTRVKSVLSGVVVGTGNTDIYPGCYSFGKWVMVKHDNGLSTIYGHLSVISVNIGQELQTGDLIGYSGNSGYSTGPHLHLGLYATQGVRIEQFVQSRGCKRVIMPLADIKAYLDPLAYLPNL